MQLAFLGVIALSHDMLLASTHLLQLPHEVVLGLLLLLSARCRRLLQFTRPLQNAL